MYAYVVNIYDYVIMHCMTYFREQRNASLAPLRHSGVCLIVETIVVQEGFLVGLSSIRDRGCSQNTGKI